MFPETHAMKPILLLSTLLALFAGSVATANPIPYIPEPTRVRMYVEKVQIIIVGDRAKVSGTYGFTFQGTRNTGRYIHLPIFLPVYGAKGAPAKGMTPKYMEEGYDEWDVMEPVEPEHDSKAIASFGDMPQLEGQVVHWFVANRHAVRLPSRTVMSLKMEYWQELSNGKFIYTPLLPNMKKDHDYGEITIVADRPLKLLNADKHDFVQKEDRLTVEPFHKRAVVVELGKRAKLLTP